MVKTSNDISLTEPREILDSSSFFERFATTFEREMFRLETLPYYGKEDETVNAYLRGESPPKYNDDMPWRANLAAKVEEGKQCRRAHIVGDPLSDYLKWEIEWAYPQNARLGEEIRIVGPAELSQTRGVANSPLAKEDFYLVDEKLLFLVKYNSAGVSTHYELFDDKRLINEAIRIRDEVMSAGWRVQPEKG